MSPAHHGQINEASTSAVRGRAWSPPWANLAEAAEHTAVQGACSTAIGVARTFQTRKGGGNDRALADANGATGNPPKISDNYRLAGSVNKVCAKMRGGWLKRKDAGLAYRSRAECPRVIEDSTASPAIAEASGAGADPSAASLAPLSVRGQTRTRRAMSISLIMEHMLTKTRPVLAAGQVRPQARRRMKSPHITGARRTSPQVLQTLDADRCPP